MPKSSNIMMKQSSYSAPIQPTSHRLAYPPTSNTRTHFKRAQNQTEGVYDVTDRQNEARMTSQRRNNVAMKADAFVSEEEGGTPHQHAVATTGLVNAFLLRALHRAVTDGDGRPGTVRVLGEELRLQSGGVDALVVQRDFHLKRQRFVRVWKVRCWICCGQAGKKGLLASSVVGFEGTKQASSTFSSMWPN